MNKKNLGKVAQINMGQSPNSDSVNMTGEGIPFLQGNAEFGEMFPDYRLYCKRPRKTCQAGDILISVRAPVGALNKAHTQFCIGRGLAAITFTDILPEYGWHVLNLQSPELQRVAQGSTFDAVNSEELARLLIPIPDFYSEQALIADILDTLDDAIHQTQQMIEKLKKVRLGLLHDLLTCGIDENGDLRDPVRHPEQFKESELGLIPKDWEVAQLSDVANVSSGSTPRRTESRYWENGTIPWVKTGEINYRTIMGTEERITELARTHYSLTIFKPHTVLMAMYGQGNTRGRVAILGIPATTNQACAAISPINDFIDHSYLYHYMTYHYNAIRNLSQGSNQANLSERVIGSFKLRVPEIEEQRYITQTLTASLDKQLAEEQTLIKLKKLKNGLSDDLLTGKVRVIDLLEDSD